MRHHNVLLLEEKCAMKHSTVVHWAQLWIRRSGCNRFIILSLIISLAKIINPVKCDASLLCLNFHRVAAGFGACRIKAVNVTVLYRLLKKGQ